MYIEHCNYIDLHKKPLKCNKASTLNSVTGSDLFWEKKTSISIGMESVVQTIPTVGLRFLDRFI